MNLIKKDHKSFKNVSWEFQERLFKISYIAKDSITYIIVGLKQKFTGSDYHFDYYFDNKIGDFYIVVCSNYKIPINFLNTFRMMKMN